MALRHTSDAKVIVSLPEGAVAAAHDAPEAFHQHFGWRSLLIAFLFLGLMMLLNEIIRRYLPAGRLSSVIREGLTILGGLHSGAPGRYYSTNGIRSGAMQ